MDARLVDRIFDEIDHNTKQLETLAKLVYELSGALSIVNKILIGLFMIIIGGFISHVFFVDKVKTDVKSEQKALIEQVESQHTELLKKYEVLLKNNGIKP